MTSDYDSSSVLRAQLVHDPKTCLTNDDLDGLNFLYPVCSNRVETPQCIEQQLNLGYLRLSLSILAAVFIPIIFVVALKIYAAIMLRCSKRLREKGLELKARKAEIQKVQQKTREAKSVAKREERQKSASTAGGAGGSRGGLGRMMSRGSSSGGSGGGVGRYMSRGSSVRPKGPEVIAEGAEDAEPEVQPVAAAELGGASVEADHEIHPVRERPDLDDTDRVAPGTTVGR
ncbi:hypothetical protein T492DRAFT_545847 [Pavlovales sp. CCMP2436]|nr:hypothetical protein T492DRAFT_545847 [Pavlovales sp. CCMP2436]